MGLASSACASSSSMKIDEILEENSRLRSEISRLKIGNAREVAELKAEIARLRGGESAPDYASSIVNFEEQPRERANGIEYTEAMVALEEDVRGKGREGGTKGSELCPDGFKRSEHCQGKCWMSKGWFTAKCVLTRSAAENETSQKKLKQGVSRDGSMKWTLKDMFRRELGTVFCPCHENGKALTEEEAIRKMIGQVSALGFPSAWRESMAETWSQGRRSKKESAWNAKVTVSFVAMLKCWQAKCLAGKGAGVSFVEEAAGAGFGAAGCGVTTGWGRRRLR